MRRRAFLRLAAAAALPVFARKASAQAYPARPVRLIVGYSAGGTADIVARIIAQRLTERLGQPVSKPDPRLDPTRPWGGEFKKPCRLGEGTDVKASATVRLRKGYRFKARLYHPI
jgi:hypothetical protein